MRSDWILHLLPFLGSVLCQCLLEDLQWAYTNHLTHLWDKRTSIPVPWTHWYNQCSVLQTHKWKVNRNLLPLCRCNSFKSWWWLQCGGQIKLKFMFTLFWGELQVSLNHCKGISCFNMATKWISRDFFWSTGLKQAPYSFMHLWFNFNTGQSLLHFICQLFIEQEQSPHPKNLSYFST